MSKDQYSIRLKVMAVNICRILMGAVLVFSGTVKIIDPRGTEYKIQDYLAVLGFGDTLFASIPLLLAVLFSACEFVFGIYMLFGIQRRLTSTAMLLIPLRIVDVSVMLSNLPIGKLSARTVCC